MRSTSRCPPPPGAVGLRRNGKQQACEPCRKGKLACDHGTPHCGRCVRRKITARCIYHPAPMTRPRVSIALAMPSPVSPNTSSSASRSSHMLSPAMTAGSQFRPDVTQSPEISHPVPVPPRNIDPALTEQSHGLHLHTPPMDLNSKLPRTRFNWDKDAVFQRSARFYGPTSFSAVFNENVDLSEDLNIGDNGRKHPSTWPFGQPLLGRDRPGAPSVRMNHIVKALWNIPSQGICEKLLNAFDCLHHITLHKVMITHCIRTLWSTFGDELAAPHSEERLSLIADVMFKNEETPLPVAPEEGMDWINGFMGPNLRFEMLGLLFCFFGMAYQTLQEWDPLFQVPENNGMDRKQTSWRMKECADVCLKMCELSEENNEISIAAQLGTAVLESVCTGDESFQTRRRLGDIIVCAIAAGLHRQPDYGPNNKVTAASEYRRRLFTAIYGSDKNHASLNGTPPVLSARFCVLRLPLDLSEEQLFLPQEELANSVARLDPDGWNTAKAAYRATYHRSLLLLNKIREEVLELSLGVDVTVSTPKIEDMHQRCCQVYAGLPEQIQYYAYDKTPKNSPARELMSQAYLMLNVLQNRFLIDRVAIARRFQNEQSLLNTAMEMVDLVTMFWIKRDQLMRYSSGFDWIITCFGIPCAGVICVELLKQATGRSLLQLSRSDAIQKLTMFIGFLEWIRPTDGNFMLAGRLRKVVRRILDRVLDPPKEMGNDVMDIPIDPMLAPFGEMDWLNTIDWTQGSWTDFS